jgi:4-amino-4-deoxy-L-arabinose transferase-like glycosyltransferase
MQNPWTVDLLQGNRPFLTIATLTLVLFGAGNLPWQLDDYDQAKQAFTSYEVVTEGHWLYQRTPDDDGPATKPPLTALISAALFTITRSWDLAWRLPSLLSAGVILVLLFRTASRAYGNTAALMAFAAFGLNLLTPRLATLVRSDMPLALTIFGIGLLVWKKIRRQEPWKTRDRLSIFGLLTAAMLIKGPIVYAFLLPGIAAYHWLAQNKNATSAWPGWWPWLASLGVFMLWLAGGLILVPRFFEVVIVREFASRFGETVHQVKPIYFYLPHLLHKFAPWSLLMIGWSIAWVRKTNGSIGEKLRSASPETVWLICWSLGAILTMSLIPSKRVDRIFPVIPPLCLLLATQTAAMLRETTSRERNVRWAHVALIVAIFLSAGAAVIRVASSYRDHRDALSIFGREVRQRAAANHWRVETVGSNDEGLPLYLMRPHFLRPERAIADWNAGKIDALAVPVDQLPRFMRALRNIAPPGLQSAPRKNLDRPNYVLLTRQ